MLIYPEEKIHSFYFKIPENKWKGIYHTLVDIHLLQKTRDSALGHKKYSDGYNFVCPNDIEELNDLYSFFLEKSQQIVGNLTLLETNNSSVWANVSGRYEKNQKHNHLKTSVINSVYYFSLPNDYDGGIDFFGKRLIHHQPKQGELLIFPNHLAHLPYCANSNIYRIALNMEIRCEQQL